jgi:hypothetical protein
MYEIMRASERRFSRTLPLRRRSKSPVAGLYAPRQNSSRRTRERCRIARESSRVDSFSPSFDRPRATALVSSGAPRARVSRGAFAVSQFFGTPVTSFAMAEAMMEAPVEGEVMAYEDGMMEAAGPLPLQTLEVRGARTAASSLPPHHAAFPRDAQTRHPSSRAR